MSFMAHSMRSCNNSTKLSFLFCGHGTLGQPLQTGIANDCLVGHARYG